MSTGKRSSGQWNAVLLACLAIALFLLVYPMYVIQPFRAQGPRELKAALAVLRYRPMVLAAAAAAAILAAVQYWRARRMPGRRILAALAAVATVGCAVLARINIYELMFHPAGRPAFVAAAADQLDGAEKVLAIRLGGEARAYPIRSISYHHIVNDWLGAVPIAATY
jgi:phosphoglycerol transferase MdoB-like AlkP superfamily enzyme